MEAGYFCRTALASGEDVSTCAGELAERLVGGRPSGTVPVRLVFFTDAADGETFRTVAERIGEVLSERYPRQRPVWSLVAQRPLSGGVPARTLAAEVHYHASPRRGAVRYGCFGKIPYVVFDDGERRELFLSVGPHNTWLPDCVPAQAEVVFGRVAEIMRREGFPVDSIQRQWNYVEGITRETHGCQHYQALNDARSEFYAPVFWTNGYPAATGIGTVCGGITVDVNAATGLVSRAVDNPLQRAAHVYSEKVLRPGDRAVPTTPKFERARVVEYGGQSLCYVSGTAAIRREESLAGMDAVRQTGVTVGNIGQLTAQVSSGCRVRSARVYVKRAEDVPAVEEAVRAAYPEADLLFLEADVCRPELLVEIEALAFG